MPTTKNALLRFQVLDKCFRNPGKDYYWQDLLEECNEALYEYNGEESTIQKRQLMDDIKFMESEAGWSIPLLRFRNNKRVYYRYEDLNYSINNQPLNETEINQLQSTLQILSKFEGLPQFDWLHEFIPKFQAGVQPNQIAPILLFDRNQYLVGIDKLGKLFNHIQYKEVLKIEYQDFKSDSSYEITIHPYILKEYNNRWFLFGYNPKTKQYNWNLALDRIQSFEIIKDKYIENTEIDWQEYFDEIIGVTKIRDKEEQKIQVWFHPSTAPYIISKPFHGSQKVISNDETGLVIRIQLIPNYEFFQALFKYRESVKVISPESIVEEMKTALKKALENYG